VIRHAIALVVISLLVPPAAAQKGSMSMGTPPRADAPLQIVGTLFNDTMLTVLLANVSGRTIEHTTMGLVLGDGASVVQPMTQIGSACIATVPPDGLLVVTAAHNGFDKADSYFREKGIVEKEATIGLVHVRFADGSAWRYPLAASGRFEEKEDQAVAGKAHALKEKHFPEKDMSWAFPGSGQEGKVSTCRR
jgi:hypothetical protein